jgi:hypothetical protein
MRLFTLSAVGDENLKPSPDALIFIPHILLALELRIRRNKIYTFNKGCRLLKGQYQEKPNGVLLYILAWKEQIIDFKL